MYSWSQPLSNLTLEFLHEVVLPHFSQDGGEGAFPGQLCLLLLKVVPGFAVGVDATDSVFKKDELFSGVFAGTVTAPGIETLLFRGSGEITWSLIKTVSGAGTLLTAETAVKTAVGAWYITDSVEAATVTGEDTGAVALA